MILQYCNAINEKTENLEGLRENYANRLREVYAVVNRQVDEETGKNKVSIDNETVEWQYRVDKYSFDNSIAAQVSNSILAQLAGNRELSELQKKGDLEVRIDFSEIPEQMEIESLDLSALLYNLLENAFESVERQVATEEVYTAGNRSGQDDQEEKQLSCPMYIQAEARKETDRLVITVKNSKSQYQSVSGHQDQWKTSKKNKKIHGYGMGIIKSIVEKYHGKMRVDFGKDWFENQVELSITHG